jgi:hypothetical protein
MRQPGVPLPFKMKLYPLPSLAAFAGWLFLWGTSGWRLLAMGAGVVVSGSLVFMIWQRLKNPLPEESGSAP